MTKKTLLAACFMVGALSACSTAPDPAKVCTAEWITARADKAMSEFKRDVSSSLNTIKKASATFESGENFNPIQLISLMSALDSLVTKFERSQALKDIKILGETCDDPEVLKRSFTKFLNDQGAPQGIIDFLVNIEDYQRLMEQTVSDRQ